MGRLSQTGGLGRVLLSAMPYYTVDFDFSWFHLARRKPRTLLPTEARSRLRLEDRELEELRTQVPPLTIRYSPLAGPVGSVTEFVG